MKKKKGPPEPKKSAGYLDGDFLPSSDDGESDQEVVTREEKVVDMSQQVGCCKLFLSHQCSHCHKRAHSLHACMPEAEQSSHHYDRKLNPQPMVPNAQSECSMVAFVPAMRLFLPIGQ